MVCHSGNAHASLDFMGDEAFLAVRQQGKAQSDPTEFRYHSSQLRLISVRQKTLVFVEK
jgi:hypothetical protein